MKAEVWVRERKRAQKILHGGFKGGEKSHKAGMQETPRSWNAGDS